MQQTNVSSSKEKLSEVFLSSKMLRHFQKKIPGVDQNILNTRIEEFLKFIFLSSKIKGGPIPVSQEIDEVWHTWILETQEYHSLCHQLPSGKYIHHSSLSNEKEFSASLEKMEDQLALDFSWIASYVANFGNFTEEAIGYWTIAKSLMQKMEWSLQDLNQFARELNSFQTSEDELA